MQKSNYKYKKAQSFVEFSFLIAVTIGALIVMISYMNRSLQGNLKQHVDNLGGERLEKGVYTPGDWYSAGDISGVVRISTRGFDYEGRMGFGVSTESTQISQHSTITGIADFDDLAPGDPNNESVLEGEEIAFVDSVYGSSFDPGIQIVQQNVNSNTQEWSQESGGNDEETGLTGSSLESVSESLYDEYGKEVDDAQMPQPFTESELQQLAGEAEIE